MCSLLGCSGTQLLKTPDTVQHRYSGPYANSVKYARSVAYKHKIFLNTGINDTIFIIERVADIGAPLLSSYMWDSKRIRVIKYEVWPTFKSTYFEYSTFDDPLCLLTEKMDTIGIKNKRGYIDAPKVFISRIIGKKTETFFFSDITVFNYIFKN